MAEAEDAGEEGRMSGRQAPEEEVLAVERELAKSEAPDTPFNEPELEEIGKAPDTPWKRATQKRRSMRSEREGAKLDGGHTTANSGAGRFKGDYRANGAMVDDKYTDARSFSIKLDGDQGFLAHIQNAVMARTLPEWRITLPGLKLRVLREEDYLYLRAKADSAENE